MTRHNVVTPRLPLTILTSRDTYIDRALGEIKEAEFNSLLKDKRTGRPMCQVKFIKKIGEANNENIDGNDLIII